MTEITTMAETTNDNSIPNETNISELKNMSNESNLNLKSLHKDILSMKNQYEEIQNLIISKETQSTDSIKDLLTSLKTISYNQNVLENKLEDALKNQMNTDILVNSISDKLLNLTNIVTALQNNDSPLINPHSHHSINNHPLSEIHSSSGTKRGPGRPRKDGTMNRISKDTNSVTSTQNERRTLPSGSVSISKSKRYFTDPINFSINSRNRESSKTLDSNISSSESYVSIAPKTSDVDDDLKSRSTKSAGELNAKTGIISTKKRRGRPPKKRTVDTVIMTTPNNDFKQENSERKMPNNITDNEDDDSYMESEQTTNVYREIVTSQDTTNSKNSRYATRNNTAKSQIDDIELIPTDIESEDEENENESDDGNYSNEHNKEYSTDRTNGEENIEQETSESKEISSSKTYNGKKQSNSEINRQQRELEKLRDPREKMLVSLKYNDRDRAKSFIKSNQKLLQALRDEERRRKLDTAVQQNKEGLSYSIPRETINQIAAAPISNRMHVLTLKPDTDGTKTHKSIIDSKQIEEATVSTIDIEKPEKTDGVGVPGTNDHNKDENLDDRAGFTMVTDDVDNEVRSENNILKTLEPTNNDNDFETATTATSGPKKRGRTNSLTFKIADGSVLGASDNSATKLDLRSSKKTKSMMSSPPNSESSSVITLNPTLSYATNGTPRSMTSIIPLSKKKPVDDGKIIKIPQDPASSNRSAATDYQATLLLGAPIELVCKDGFFFRRNAPKIPITTGAYLEFRFLAKEQELKAKGEEDSNKGFVVATLSKGDKSNTLTLQSYVAVETEEAFDILGKTTLTEKYVNSLEYFLMEFRWENKLIGLGLKLRESKRTWQRRKALFALFEFWRDQSRDKRGFPNYTILHAVKEMENYRIFINRSVSWFYNHITLLKMILYDLCYEPKTSWREWMFPVGCKLPCLGDTLDDGSIITKVNINEIIDNLLVFDFLDDGSMNKQVKSSKVIIPDHAK